MASLTGFFSQQIVLVQSCLEIDETAAVSISKTNNYTRSASSDPRMLSTDYTPMIAAINVGLIQPLDDLTNVLSQGCSTGNCTFHSTNNASFSTLGIGHLCEDITTRIHVENETTTSSPVGNFTSEFLALDYDVDQSMAFSPENDGFLVKTWTSPREGMITTLYILYKPSYESLEYKAVNCSIFPTVNTYVADIRNSILKETLMSSTPLLLPGAQFKNYGNTEEEFANPSISYSFMTASNYTLRDGYEESCDGSETPGPGLSKFMKSTEDPTYVNSTGQTSTSAGWKWWYFPNDCIWSMTQASADGMKRTFNDIFVDQKLSMGRYGGLEGPIHLRRIFHDGNMTLDTVNELMEGLTATMTTVIRTNGEEGPSGNARGQVWINTTCVYIRWRWITFPTVMIALTGVFLIWVAFENRDVQSDRLWKSSLLAALFCEFELTQDKPEGKQEMATTAKSTSVCLDANGGTLRLVGQ
jgi:hypothetical protein